MDRDAADVVAANLDLSRMESYANVEAERPQGHGQLTPARDAARRAIKRGKHTIAGRISREKPASRR